MNMFSHFIESLSDKQNFLNLGVIKNNWQFITLLLKLKIYVKFTDCVVHITLSLVTSLFSAEFLAQCTTNVYQKSDGSCACGFYLETDLSWREAADRCYAQGARLPEIYSAAENDAILNLRVIKSCYILTMILCIMIRLSPNLNNVKKIDIKIQ